MEKLEEAVIELFKEEHQDWVTNLKKAEASGDGVDVNLGGKFADRLSSLMTEFRNFKLRHKEKKRWFK